MSFYLLIRILLNYFVFSLFNTIVEIKIVRSLNKEIDERPRKLAAMGVNESDTAQTKKMESDARKERRALLMVILGGLINFLCRSTDLLNAFSNSEHLVGSNFWYYYICEVLFLCITFIDVSNLYLHSHLTFSFICSLIRNLERPFSKSKLIKKCI
jgi:hypothetical protein